MTRQGWPYSSIAAVLALALALMAKVSRADEAPRVDPTYDCGSLSLYTLSRFEGLPLTLTTIDAHLPAPVPRGYSMKQLRDAAYPCGLKLTGVRLLPGDRAPDRPALVFLKRGPHGHFIAIRPVGHTGRLVQVLDPNEPPDVIDAADLYARPDWTGLALIPNRPNWPARIVGGLALSGAIGSLAWGLMIRRRSRRETAEAVRLGEPA